jgi:hypothetical protein
MVSRCSLLILVLLALPATLAASTALSAFRRDNEQDLVTRIQRESNPVKKAKYEIRLGRLKLQQAARAYDGGNFEEGQKLLAEYLARMKDSWSILQKSGRQAVRQPQGFKDLDIALREDSRTLTDLAHRVSFQDRDPVTKTAKEVEEIRNEVLKALFPAEKPKGRG